MTRATVGTRVVLLSAVTAATSPLAGVIIEERVESYLKRFVVRCDNERICFASESELALEDDPKRAPLGPPVHAD
jgi:hypothetical protein